MSNYNTNLRLPIHIQLADLAELLNKNLPDNEIIYEDANFSPLPKEILKLFYLRAKIQLIKTGKISLLSKRNQVFARVPILVILQALHGNDNPFGNLKTLETQAKLTLTIQIKPEITTNWFLKTNSKIVDFEWGQHLILQVLGIPLDLGFLVNQRLVKLLPTLLPKIDAPIRAIDLSEFIAEAWLLCQQPIEVYEKPSIWLCAQPEQITISPILANDTDLYCTASIVGNLYAWVGQKTDFMPQVNLPEADFSMIKKEHSEVLLPFTLTYHDANKLTQKKWAKKWYQKPIGGNSFPVMIENLTFVPEKNHHIKAIAEISGTIKGLLHITAKPSLSADHNHLAFKQVAVSLDTQSKVWQIAGGLLLPGVLSGILESKLQFSLGKFLETIRRSIEETICKYKPSSALQIQAAIDPILIKRIEIDDEKVCVNLFIAGNIILQILPAQFSSFD